MERLLNYCLNNGIRIRKVKYLSDTKIMFIIRARDYNKLADIAGARYRIKCTDEGGLIFRAAVFLKRKEFVAGIIIFTAFFFYQSLFISEIEVAGYETISEQALRTSMEEAGFCEGCRKNINLDKIKLHLYEEFDNLVWVGIKYKGNLAQVTVSEGGSLYKKNMVEDNKPCNIVADRDGYISSIDPEQGIRAAEDGDFVEEGDVLISGIIPLSQTTYTIEENKKTEAYVHAKGTVYAKIPVHVDFYEYAYDTVIEKTGKRYFLISFNNYKLGNLFCHYETSKTKAFTIIDQVKPFRLKIQLHRVEEITVKEEQITNKKLKKELLNKLHEYTEENLPDNTQILNKGLNFSREKNIIYISVTLETLQNIGIEEEIVVDKSNRESDQNDDQ